VVDAWQLTIADVGPAGVDQGKGGKLLFTPPGYKDAIPAGYMHVPSPNYRIALAFRSVPAPGKSAADAYAYSKQDGGLDGARVRRPVQWLATVGGEADLGECLQEVC
jgi:hypothetical protein